MNIYLFPVCQACRMEIEWQSLEGSALHIIADKITLASSLRKVHECNLALVRAPAWKLIKCYRVKSKLS